MGTEGTVHYYIVSYFTKRYFGTCCTVLFTFSLLIIVRIVFQMKDIFTQEIYKQLIRLKQEKYIRNR